MVYDTLFDMQNSEGGVKLKSHSSFILLILQRIDQLIKSGLRAALTGILAYIAKTHLTRVRASSGLVVALLGIIGT